ncbi:Fe-S-cluster containining protein [Variovorax boronicumulans]|uniref:Fe-S-cluster containining protein n=1 Tax=Variovorax boronicumulans TaxID=436515 RepID=A0AAW8D4F3_9BURK|nr:YkgJ family cysteine cluster protein [Variovorax boronicumulans]MDP9894882.1 Fe-S-cluster containining protein [Variovorax boronicumulans]MDQ0038590.1 Fe-S-cluster containining protein [Variovorax boronicumulans]MDQ0054798.1 Fe-S-cluster containining protein [Variovorax boronicumulans]
MTSATATSDLAQQQRERLPLAMQRAQTKLAGLADDGAAKPLLKASQKAATAARRVVWLQRAASAWARPMEAVSACRSGCSHCCHIPVTISLIEAQLLGRASGRMPSEPPRSIRLADAVSVESLALMERPLHEGPVAPCPFLHSGRCTVYEQRPMACRTLLNLDDDDLLCRHADGVQADVPYADATKLKLFALMAQAGTRYADIRDFFPDAQGA